MIIDSPIVSGSYAGTGSFNQVGNVSISGSLTVTGSIIGNLTGTASYATTSSYALTASYAANVPETSSYAISASYAINATSASYAANSTSASYAQTASYANNIIISGSIANVDYIDFDLTASFASALGRLGYDSGEGTLQFGMAGGNVTLNIGSDLYQYVYNDTTASMSRGQVVYISGSQGNRIAVKLASATAELGSANTLGFVAETITAGGEGWVMTEGNLRGLDTSTLIGGRLIYLGTTPGTYTQTPPVAPDHGVRLGYAERIDNTVGSIYVKIDNGYELGELHDVVDSTTSASYGDLLVRNGSVWTNSKQLTGSYGVTGSINVVGGITATNTITAQTLVVQTVTSSVVYSSGSNIFGNDLTNSQILTGSVSVTGSLAVNGSNVILTNQTSSMSVATASYVENAQTASFVLNAVSASRAVSSSYANNATLAQYASNIALLADNTDTTLYPVFSANVAASTYSTLRGNPSGALSYNAVNYVLTLTSGSVVAPSFTGSLLGTASYADNATSASYAASASNSLFAQTASYWSGSITNAATASYVENAQTASFVQNAQSASYWSGSITNALSSSYALTASYSANVPETASYATSASNALVATSASYALTASYISGSGGGVGFPFSGSAVITGSLLITNLTGSGVRYVVTDANGLMTAQTASAAIKYNQVFTASAGQTTFATANGYTTGYIDVFINGTKLTRGAEYTDTSGTDVVLITGSMSNDIVELVTYLPVSGVSNNVLRQLTTFTASAGQTTFSASYVPGLLDIYYNGSHLSTGDYDASNGTYFTLATASAAGDILDVFVYSYQVGAFSGIGGSGSASQIAYYSTGNSITGSPNFTISGSTMTVTGSLTVSGSGTFTNIGPAVFSGSITSTAGFTGSFSGTATSASYADVANSASYAASASNALAAATASYVLNAISASYAASASNALSSSNAVIAQTASYANTFTVGSTLTAQTIVVQTITSSIDYITGSSINGSLLSNTHLITGSLYQTGSIAAFAGNVAVGSSSAWNPGGSSQISLDLYNPGGSTYSTFYARSATVVGAVSAESANSQFVVGTTSNHPLVFYTNNAAKMYISSSGFIGIGTTSPLTNTQIAGTNGVIDSYGQLFISTTNTATQDFGGQITLGGFYNGTTNQVAFGSISSRKENSTANNLLGYIAFATQTGSLVERMRITSAGFVGIGTTSPAYTLDVSGTLRATGAATFSSTITAGALSRIGDVYIGGRSGTYATYTDGIIGDNLHLAASGTGGAVYINTALSRNTYINPVGGNVGIGTTSPSRKLHILSTDDTRGILINNTSTTSYAELHFSASREYRIGTGGSSADPSAIDRWYVYDNTAGAHRFTINSSGNVGIGTTNPTGKLDVANRGITVGSMPAGSVIQVVTYKLASGFSTSSGSDQDSGLKVSITPTSSTSKILVLISANIRATNSGGNCYANCKLVRGAFDTGTALHNGFAVIGNFGSTDIRGSLSFSYLDSPATTSSTQYVVSMNSTYAATVYMDSTTSPSTITLMEIAQ